MRKVIVGAFVSLDGVMQAPGGPNEDISGGFRFGGWVGAHFDEVGMGAVGEMLNKPYDLLLGRKTYDIFAGYWPHHTDNPIGEAFDRVTKYVATRNTDFVPEWKNSVSLAPDAVAAVRGLKAGDGPDLLTQGSPDFLQSLFAADLVDEMQLMTFPVILGQGKRLFTGAGAPGAWTLFDSKVSGTGVVIGRYRRSGEVPIHDLT